MAVTNWTDLAALAAVLVALIAPVLGWMLARKGQRDDARRQLKLNVFGGVMENRHSTESVEAIRALNLVDVAFHDSPEVRRLWREYFEMISNKAFFQDALGKQLRDQKIQELLTEMARNLEFGIDRFDVARIYVPQWLVEQEALNARERQHRIAALLQGQREPPSTQPAVTPSNLPPQLTPPAPSSVEAAQSPAIYLVRYVGAQSQGVATLVIGNGLISGSDVVGGRYEGSYQMVGERLSGMATLSVPGGTTLATGATVDRPSNIPITIDLPSKFADGHPHTIKVADQPVQVTFERIQDL